MKKKLLILFVCSIGMFENNHPLSKKSEFLPSQHLKNLEEIEKIKKQRAYLQQLKTSQQPAEALKNISDTNPAQGKLKTGFWAGIAARSYSLYEYLKGIIPRHQKFPPKETESVNEK